MNITNITGRIKSAFRKKSVIGITALVLIAVIYFGFQSANGSNVIRYTMAAVTKGTLISTISGSGQVTVSQQTDIKPKVSGQIISLQVKNGQFVKAGTIIARIDSSNAQKSVRDANISLQNAQLAMEKLKQPSDEASVSLARSALTQAQADLKKLQDPPDESTLLQAQNSVSQAQRTYDQAVANNTQTTLDATQSFNKALDDGYNAVSSAYLDLPDLIKDTYDVQWGDADFREPRVPGYQVILGESSKFITVAVNDYNNAFGLFDKSFNNYKNTSRTDDPDTLKKLLDETLATAKAISQAIESSRNMLDAITNRDYKNFTGASTVDSLKLVMMADITVINKNVTALQSAKDTIDNTKSSSPIDVKKAQDAVSSAQENLKEKQTTLDKLLAGATPEDLAVAQETVKQKQYNLDKLLAGADPLDVRTQQLNIQSKENTLADAEQTLQDYTVRAPFDCVIAAVNVAGSDTISSGTSIATVVTKQMLADVSLNEVDVAKIKTGEKVTLTFDAIDGLSITGEVADIDTLGTTTQGVVSYSVKISFDTQDERIKPGMSVSATIINNVKQDVLLVPNTAVKTQGDVSYVETIDNANTTASQGTADALMVTSNAPPTQIQIETGIANDTSTEITNGLKEGDQIIVKTTTATTKTATTTKSSSLRGVEIMGGGGPPG